MSLRFEAWTLPWDSSGFQRVISDIPVVEGTGRGTKRFNEFGSEGQIGVPADYDRLNEIIASDTGTLIRVYDGSTVIQEFMAERVEEQAAGEHQVSVISGADLASVFDRTIVYPYDYPTNPSAFPNHVWGGPNVLSNANFDDIDPTVIVYELYTDATGGTFTLSDGTDTTSAIAYNASEGTVETELQTDITAITDVNVEGSGTASDPWVIEFVDPAFGITLTVDGSSLTGGTATLTLAQAGEALPAFWTKSKQISVGTPVTFGGYDTFELSTDFADSGTYSLKIDPASIGLRYAGAQQVVNVKPGGTYQASIKVRTTDANDQYRFVVRKLNGEFIASDSGGLTGTSYATGSWHEVTISDLQIPAGVEQVIFRFANVDASGDPATFYLDSAQLNEGLAATTIGDMVTALMDDATSDHSADTRGTLLTWVDYSGFDATNDSTTTAWDESIAYTAYRGKTYGQVWDDFRELGYEFTLTPKTNSDSYAAGADTHDLNWYNEDAAGTDHTTSDSPAINVGQSIVGGPVVQRIPDVTAVLVEGEGAAYTEGSDATTLSDFGRFEKYIGDRALGDATTRTAASDQVFAAESENRIALQLEIVRNPAHPIPLVDYAPGDTIYFQIPPRVSKQSRRIQYVTWRNTEPATYQVTGSRLFPGESGAYEALRKLIRKFDALEDPTGGDGVPLLGGAGGAFTIQVAASDAHDIEKEKADLIAPGVNDHNVLQAAADLIHQNSANDGGRILLSSGQFNISTGQLSIGNAITIEGMGDETRIATTDSTGTMLTAGASCSFYNFRLVGSSTALGFDLGNECTVDNIRFQSLDVAIEPGNECIITRCDCTSVTEFVDATPVFNDIVIANNMSIAAITLGASTNALVVGNRLNNEVSADGGYGIAVVGNVWVDGVSTSQTFELINFANLQAFTVADNVCNNAGGFDCIKIDTCRAGVIEGNHFDGPDYGFDILSSSHITVGGNVIGGGSEQYVGEYGIQLSGTSDSTVIANIIIEAGQNTNNTWDGINLTGDSNRNLITSNHISSGTASPQTRYAINVGTSTCDDNVVVGNHFGGSANYASGAYNDAGTNTVNTYPNHGTWGDNFAV